MATRVLQVGYYLLTLRTNCSNFVKKFIQCQRHGNLIHRSAEELHPMVSPWPFAIWGIYILGPFPTALGQRKFLLVVVDYFTKWVEAEPLANITTQEVQKFFWRNIITRFGITNTLVTDNDLQFIDLKLNEFLNGFCIKHRVISVEHPQTNRQAEITNKVILGEMKKPLEGAKGRQAEKLVEILWAYRCTPQSTIEETPFRLTYRMDAMLLVKVGEVSLLRNCFAEPQNNETLQVDLDLLSKYEKNVVIMTKACK